MKIKQYLWATLAGLSLLTTSCDKKEDNSNQANNLETITNITKERKPEKVKETYPINIITEKYKSNNFEFEKKLITKKVNFQYKSGFQNKTFFIDGGYINEYHEIRDENGLLKESNVKFVDGLHSKFVYGYFEDGDNNPDYVTETTNFSRFDKSKIFEQNVFKVIGGNLKTGLILKLEEGKETKDFDKKYIFENEDNALWMHVGKLPVSNRSSKGYKTFLKFTNAENTYSYNESTNSYNVESTYTGTIPFYDTKEKTSSIVVNGETKTKKITIETETELPLVMNVKVTNITKKYNQYRSNNNTKFNYTTKIDGKKVNERVFSNFTFAPKKDRY